jgi:hypothetical protein
MRAAPTADAQGQATQIARTAFTSGFVEHDGLIKRDFPPTTTEIQVTYPADLVGPADGDISTVKGMFDELVHRGRGPVREVEAALRAMGYVPAVPERQGDKPREVYLGWADPARDYTNGKYTVSLDSRTIWFSHKILMDPAGRFRVDENGGAHVARRRRFGLALRDRP